MVGVPGRSKGCHTCRRRKKGCDLQQPSCGPCKKACIPCEGYPRSLTFYHYHGHDKKSKTSLSLETREIETNNPKPITSAELVAFVDFSRTANESGLEGLFWESYMPNSQFFALFNETQRALGGSISVIRTLLPGTSLLRPAIGALALRTAANKDDAPHWMKQQGIKLHIHGLQHMRRALSQSKKNTLEFLCAARIFGFYEALYGSDSTNQQAQYRSWSSHNSGDLALTISHPPSFFATGPAHRLFVDGRLHLAQCAIGTRKGLVLSEPEWLTDPWTHHPKTRKDMLVDILLEIPSLYENVDNMNLLPDGKIKSSHRHNIQKMNYVIMTRLENWNTRYAATLPTTYSGPHWQTLSSVETNSIADAHVMAIYWASSIHAYHIYRTVSDGECDFIGLDPDDCCRSIIRCVPLFLHPSTGIFRQHLIPFPLMTADRHLNSVQSTKLQAERDYLQALRESPKFAAMHQFISSMQSQIVTF